MMSTRYKQFTFEKYDFNTDTKTLQLHYSLDGVVKFRETYVFNFSFADYDQAVLEKSLQTLFYLAGVSYYKTYVPSEIVIRDGKLSTEDAAFFSKTYQRGLGEFWYLNKLDPRTPVNFPADDTAPATSLGHSGSGILVGLGGGKDSLVTVEMLRQSGRALTTWALGHQSQLHPLVDKIGLPHLSVERTWDRKLLELNEVDAFNGHIPISAILAAAGTVVAVLSGRRDVAVSNEYAANEPTLTYQGVDINHQYSKSQEFEKDYQAYLRRAFGDSLRYYSLLRPLSELRIGELFAKSIFATYHDVFSSCNHAYTHDSDHMFWCGHCPKCAFVFMILTPFVPRKSVEALWHGKNLLLDPDLRPLYRQLLGIEGDKPLECVGEIKESRAAMRMCQQIYHELQPVYKFELPDDYDYKQLMSDEMPAEIKLLFDEALQKSQA